MADNLIGPQGQLYADPKPGADPTQFQQDNNSAAYYQSPYFIAHKNQVQPIPRRRGASPLNLSDFIPASLLGAIQSGGKIAFHATGDTGAAKVNRSQTAATAIGHETAVADALVSDIARPGNAPAFFFHLGDVIYNFGEAQYYYDQFYEPYRAYDRPIFAVPGNHDGMVFGQGSSAPQVPTLDAFLTNFCAATPGPSPDAGGLMRSVMTQPGVYFTLDAPFVSIIGLYSNVLDGPGVISSQGGHFPLVDDQLGFLTSELTRLKPARQAQQRAVVLAVHHPPLSADAKHSGSTGVQADIDACCQKAGLWPDLVLSGHAHLYQRFTRLVGGKQTPYIVCGAGGFAATPPFTKVPPAPVTIGDHTLEIDPIVRFGYLTIETDAKTLSVTFKTADAQGVVVRDSITVDLASGKLTASKGSSKAPPAKKGAPKAKAKSSQGKAAKGKTAKAKTSGAKPARTRVAGAGRKKPAPRGPASRKGRSR
ncbi:3',5'-cyclic AMP phosphodiesterase CpdA [Rhizobiales bacterium GAS113]|nr:3',5'-cyclic AMP phosphodiesterase CpdA [Rhizobiales bacterium GAS113]